MGINAYHRHHRRLLMHAFSTYQGIPEYICENHTHTEDNQSISLITHRRHQNLHPRHQVVLHPRL